MEKTDLVNLLSEMLIPMGFKRKGNNWILKGDELTKTVNLQKSQFSRTYYVNYDYILNALPSDPSYIGGRVGFSTPDENLKLDKLLDLDSDIPDKEKIDALRDIFQEQIVKGFQSINTEEDLSNKFRKKMPVLITQALKQHLHLPEQV
jgi:hypothetical protein